MRRTIGRADMTRRAFLGRCGEVIALPFMASLLPRRLWAAEAAAAAPTRYLSFFVPCGMYMDAWTPATSGASYTMSATLAPLQSFQNKMTVITGLSNLVPGSPKVNGDHARGTASFNTASLIGPAGGSLHNGVSADQVVAQASASKTRIGSLQLGLPDNATNDSGYASAYNGSTSWSSPTTNLPPVTSPSAIFQRMFSNASAASVGKAASNTAGQKSILDAVIGQATSMQQKLGVNDKQALDQYLTAIRSVEQSLTASTSTLASCQSPSNTFASTGDIDAAYAQWVQLMTLAFQCDQTRAISFMWAAGESFRIYKNLGISAAHHSISHYKTGESGLSQTDAIAALKKIQLYEVTNFAKLLTAFQAVVEGSATMLDNCVIVFSSEMSDSNAHDHTNMPVVLAGGGSGSIKTNGQHIVDGNQTDFAQLLLTSIRAAGVNAASFGQSNQTASYPAILG